MKNFIIKYGYGEETQSEENIIGEPLRPIRTIILPKNGVIGLGACLHQARAFVIKKKIIFITKNYYFEYLYITPINDYYGK